MVNPTYKHLETSPRLGAFSIGQWAQIALAAGLAAVFSLYLSPFSTTVTVFIAIVGAGSPVALCYGAMGRDFSPADQAAAAWRYWCSPGRYLSGPGQLPAGYLVLAPDPDPDPPAAPVERARPVELEDTLWDA